MYRNLSFILPVSTTGSKAAAFVVQFGKYG